MGIVMDVGCNDGSDTLAWLRRGYCVVSIDANPQMTELTARRSSAFKQRVRLMTYGVDETPGSLTFWLTSDPAHSSFDRGKAERADPTGVTARIIPTVRCETLWDSFVGRPYFLKIDIEERHYVCVQALRHVQRERLPLYDIDYVAFERHATQHKGLPAPMLDAQLLLTLYQIGYHTAKVRPGYSFTASGNESPEEVMDGRTNSTAWVPLPQLFRRGLTPGQATPAQHSHWHDWIVKLRV